jgi:hypothetical protein
VRIACMGILGSLTTSKMIEINYDGNPSLTTILFS